MILKRIFFLSCLLAVSCNLFAFYDYQSIQKQGHQIHLLEFNPDDYEIVAVKVNQGGQTRETVSELVKQTGAFAGINGGFFHGGEQDGLPAGALKIHSQWIGFQTLGRAAMGWDVENPKDVRMDRIVTQVKNGVEVLPQLDKSKGSLHAWQNFDTIVGGTPLLIQHGSVITDYTSEKPLRSFITERHARTAVCIKDNDHWVFVVASHTKAADRAHLTKIIEGLTIKELTQLLQQLSCKNAINLDGGGSSTLVINGEIVNNPAGDRDTMTNHYRERAVSDALLIFPRA